MSRPFPKGLGHATLLVGLAGCISERPATAPSPPASGGPSVAISNLAFVPATLSVRTGTLVTGTNDDDVDHTASRVRCMARWVQPCDGTRA